MTVSLYRRFLHRQLVLPLGKVIHLVLWKGLVYDCAVSKSGRSAEDKGGFPGLELRSSSLVNLHMASCLPTRCWRLLVLRAAFRGSTLDTFFAWVVFKLAGISEMAFSSEPIQTIPSSPGCKLHLPILCGTLLGSRVGSLTFARVL